MTVIVFDKENNQTPYSYDPEHRESVIAFYADLFANGEINGYRVE